MRLILSIPAAVAALAGGLAICLLAANASAATKPSHHHMHPHVFVYRDSRPPLTVNKRSWLDPGPVVPVGSMQSYVTETTGFNQTPDEAYFPSRFHEDVLPRPLYPTGRPVPVVDFWTPAYPY